MTAIIVLSILGILFVWFLYWAYLPDYKRDPEDFKKTLIGMPLSIAASFFGMSGIGEKIKQWANRKPNPKQDDE